MIAAEAAIRFIETLKLPEGPHAGERIKLAGFQKRFLRGALADGVTIGALSVGRGSGKTMLGAALCLGALLGKLGDRQPRREVTVAAKVRDQGMVAFRYIEGLAASLPIKTRKLLTFVKAPRLEVRYDGDGGGHSIRVLASDARNALGLSPVFALLDERGFWLPEGDRLEEAILTAMGKRAGRCIAISTSAPTDSHSFSRLLDDPGEGAFVQEHRAPDGCEPDDIEALKVANPGSAEGIGPSLAWLQAQGRRAASRGGSALASHRLFVLNQRTSDEARAVLVTVDQWQRCEVAELPPRDGPLTVGIDLGGSASMTAWAAFWPTTGRLEAFGAFATTERALSPDHNLGIQVKITRKSLKQSGAALEAAIRRDINGTMQDVLDAGVFNGTGSSGQPLGVIYGQSTYGYGTTAVSAAASASVFRTVAATFMGASSANGPADVKVLTHPQTWTYMDGTLVSGTAVSQWDLHLKNFPAANNVLSTRATLTAGTPDSTVALLATSAGGVAPIFIGAWGGIDLIRDPYSDAQSGMLRLTALSTIDVNISRTAQLHLLTALQVE